MAKNPLGKDSVVGGAVYNARLRVKLAKNRIEIERAEIEKQLQEGQKRISEIRASTAAVIPVPSSSPTRQLPKFNLDGQKKGGMSRKRKIGGVFVAMIVFLAVYSYMGSVTTVEMVRLVAAFLVAAPPIAIILTRNTKASEDEEEMNPQRFPSPSQNNLSTHEETWFRRVLISLLDQGGMSIEVTAKGEKSVDIGGLVLTTRGTGKPVLVREEKTSLVLNGEEEDDRVDGIISPPPQVGS